MAGRLQKKVSFLYTWVLLGFFLPVFVVYIEENLSVILVVSFGLALIYQLYEVFLSFVRGEVVLMVYCFKNLYFSLYFSFYNFNLL